MPSAPPPLARPIAALAGAAARLAGALPSVCAACGAFSNGRAAPGPFASGRVCADCLARFAAPRPRCACCAEPLPAAGRGPDADAAAAAHGDEHAGGPPAPPICGACLVDPPPYDAAVAGVDYAPPWNRLLAAFKFRDAPELAGPLAARLVAALAGRPDVAPDLVVPVPLAPARLAERGHNQAWELARRVARAIGARATPSLLVRVRETPHQLDLPPGERAGNVRGAFAVEPARAAAVAGRRVLLVDDVMTTGATVGEAARVLRAAGARSVAVGVVARVPRPGGR